MIRITNHESRITILGIGSNLGDRLLNLKNAVSGLSGFINNINISKVYESEAVLLEGAPSAWRKPFLNAAISGDTELSPNELLASIKSLEKNLGRKENYPKWSPRIIDVDILVMGDLILDEPHLKIPHPLLFERPFALWPLADIAPDWKYNGKKAAELSLKFDKNCGTKLTDYKINL